MLRRTLLRTALAATVTIATAAGSAQAAVVDPDRNSSAEVGTFLLLDRTFAQLDEFRKANGARIIDLEVTRTSPLRLSAVLVRNEGAYKRSPSNGYGAGFTEAQIRSRMASNNGRVIDVEPYFTNGRLRFAFVWIRNTGQARKTYEWGGFLPLSTVISRVNQLGMKLVHLQSIQLFGQRFWSFIAIRKTGVDSAGTFRLHNATASFLEKTRAANAGRIIDLERRSTGRFDALMTRDDPIFDLYTIGVTAERLGQLVASAAVRIVDIEPYGSGAGRRYAVTLRDNVDSESARIRAIVWPAWNHGYYGVYAKIVGGPVIARLAHQSPYQPASTMKLVPHLFVMDRIDRNALGDVDRDGKSEGLDETMSWRSPTGMPDAHACPDVTTGVTRYSDTFREVIRRGLAESLGRSHEALLDLFGANPPSGYNTAQWGAKVITDRVRQLGLKNTTMFPGCTSSNGRPDFYSSRTTLEDIGWLFEGVDRGTLLGNVSPKSRDDFRTLVANAGTEIFRQVVTEEAGSQRSDIVEPFISAMGLEGKPGGLDPGSFPNNVTRAWSDHLRLPTKQPNGADGAPLHAVGGLFLNDFRYECHEDAPNKPGATQKCKTFMARHLAAWNCAYAERYRLAIRQAIRTWPVNAGGPKPVSPGPRCGP